MVKKNNKENGRVLRVVSMRGRYRLCWAVVDAEGDVDYLLPSEDIDLSFRTFEEMKTLIELVDEARKMSVLHVSAANRHLLIKQDYTEE